LLLPLLRAPHAFQLHRITREADVTVELRSPLPVDLTSFIGRQAELKALHELLASSRLLTLTGAGGSGKTRLALELSRNVEREGGRTVAWTDLAAVGDESLIGRQVSEAFGITEELSGERLEGVIDVLRSRRALLVLDNCEHLVDACAELADAVLQTCPGVQILATSREALGVRGERAWLVPPLATPGPDHADPASCESVRLFVDRARDTTPGFELTPDNLCDVAEICRRLDGIPLAIELAAARTAILSPAQIRQRLDNVFALLGTGRRTVIPRHRTLRAAIDWSHDLLRPDSRILFRRLSVFRGGFTLDAVEEVASDDDLAAADVLEGIARLAERSLITVREQHGTARYHLLETVRQYATERLQESGELIPAQTRLALHISRLVAEAEPHLVGLERPVWVERLHADIDNIREVLYWTRENDPQTHIRLCGMLWWYWYSAGSWTEARRWLADALNLPAAAAPTRERAALLFASGALAALQGRADDARPRLTESARVAASAGDERLEAYALNYYGMTWSQLLRSDGRAANEKAAAWFRAHRDYYGLRLAELLLGFAAAADGDVPGSIRHAEEAVAIARAHALDRELSVALHCLGILLLRTGDLARAEPLLQEALAASSRDPSYLFLAQTLEYLALVMGKRGDPLRAARVLGSAQSVRELIGARRFQMDVPHLEEAIAKLRAAVTEDAFNHAMEEGRRLSADEAIAEILGTTSDGSPAQAGTGDASSTDQQTQATASTQLQVSDPRPGNAVISVTPIGGTTPVAATPISVPDLAVSALGPFRVVLGDDPVQERAWPYSKPRELLVYLLLHPAGRTRDQIAGAIWPTATPAQLRNSFHVTVHHLRKALGGNHWVLLKDDRYMLDPTAAVHFDATAFETAVRAALAADEETGAEQLLRNAMKMYRGDLLEGEVAGPWHEEHRANLRRLHVDAALRLGQILESHGDMSAAIDIYRDIVQRDDLHEEAHRLLMAAWARSGDRVRAIRHYERLVVLLQQVLDAEPEPETTELFDRIRAAAV
jgi:predicted ATPase/DNA-binding SARP family transcriptional activator